MKHVIFFDGDCLFCHKAVNRILAMDRSAVFFFAPLNGLTAQEELTGKYAALRDKNSLVLLENFRTPKRRFWIRSRGVFRILWLLGGPWRLIGWLYWMPIGADLVYRLIAHHRHFIGGKLSKIIPFEHAERFLP